MSQLTSLIIQQGKILEEIYSFRFRINGKQCSMDQYFDLKRKISQELELIASKIQQVVAQAGALKIGGGLYKITGAVFTVLSLLNPATAGYGAAAAFYGIGGIALSQIGDLIKRSDCDKYLKQLQARIKIIQETDTRMASMFDRLSNNLQKIDEFMREKKQSFGYYMKSLQGSQALKKMSKPIKLIINENIRSLSYQNNMSQFYQAGVEYGNELLSKITSAKLNFLGDYHVSSYGKTLYGLMKPSKTSMYICAFCYLFIKQLGPNLPASLLQGGKVLSYGGKLMSQGGKILISEAKQLGQGVVKSLFTSFKGMLQILKNFLIIVGIGWSFYSGCKDLYEGFKDMSGSQLANQLRSCKRQYDIANNLQQIVFKQAKNTYSQMCQLQEKIVSQEKALQQKIQQKEWQQRQRQRQRQKEKRNQKIKIAVIVIIFSGIVFAFLNGWNYELSSTKLRFIFTANNQENEAYKQQQKQSQQNNQQGQQSSGGSSHQDKQNNKEQKQQGHDDQSQDNRKPNKDHKNSNKEDSQKQEQKKKSLIQQIMKIIKKLMKKFQNPNDLKKPKIKKQHIDSGQKQYQTKTLNFKNISSHHIYPGSFIVYLIRQVPEQSLAIILSEYLLNNPDLHQRFQQNYSSIDEFLAGRLYWNPPNLVQGPSQPFRDNDPGPLIDWEILSTRSQQFQNTFNQMIENLGNPQNRSIPGLNITHGFEIYLSLLKENYASWELNNQTGKYKTQKNITSRLNPNPNSD